MSEAWSPECKEGLRLASEWGYSELAIMFYELGNGVKADLNVMMKHGLFGRRRIG